MMEKSLRKATLRSTIIRPKRSRSGKRRWNCGFWRPGTQPKMFFMAPVKYIRVWFLSLGSEMSTSASTAALAIVKFFTSPAAGVVHLDGLAEVRPGGAFGLCGFGEPAFSEGGRPELEARGLAHENPSPLPFDFA